MKKITLIFTISLLFILYNCEALLNNNDIPDANNPFDTTQTDYIAPKTTILTSPSNGSTINNDFTTIKWTGSNINSTFSWKFNESAWTDWSQDSTVELQHLDDKSHLFEVRSKYLNGDIEDTPVSVQFFVDAVKGPALRMEKKYLTVNTGEDFTIDIWLEEVTDLFIMSIEMSYDTQYLNFKELNENTNDGALIDMSSDNVIYLKNINENDGKIETYISLKDQTAGISGTGKIFTIKFSGTKTGNTEVVFTNNCKMRTDQNNVININEKVNSSIVIK